MRPHPFNKLLGESKAQVTKCLGPDGWDVVPDKLGCQSSQFFGVTKSASVLLGAPRYAGPTHCVTSLQQEYAWACRRLPCLALSDHPPFLLSLSPPLLFS